MEEINILRLEGRVFCFDPREARQRKAQIIATDEHGQEVRIELHPTYGQPSVLAYKVLQAIFLKVTEDGCSLTSDGRAVYSDTANFSQRELAVLVGRAWGGKTSREIFDAFQQLQTRGSSHRSTKKIRRRGSQHPSISSPRSTLLVVGKPSPVARCAYRPRSWRASTSATSHSSTCTG